MATAGSDAGPFGRDFGICPARRARDVVMAPMLVAAAEPISRLLADKAYDSNLLRPLLADKAIEPVIPRSGDARARSRADDRSHLDEALAAIIMER
jgi:hypothetical protein